MLAVITLGLVGFAALGVWIVLPYLYRIANVKNLEARCRASKTIVLTYDDGPSANFTPELLDLLKEYDAPATFFVLGVQADNNVGVVPKIVENGHEVGSHSYRHLNAWKDLPWKVASDIEAGIDCLNRKDVQITYFRPPNGKITLATLLQTLLKGRRMAWWTIDSTDTCPETISAEKLAETVKDAGGGVILLHDFERKTDKDRNRFVLDATRQLLEMAKAEKFAVRTFGQLEQNA
ncbi:polysaccharide deacetylase family protein [Sneathiella litorea]|uniref:Chitooligosaccharide deacetylase n=1 Tax=Sneathiella litorea TaxID=2606216 RepID=A0A6L8W5E1_9PROT|nr:polysaccharide deacetylase family protein [Sneathiella litorea]MZR29703.1 polysaccharide deacetylase family protein [Sneathiella litorea]